jgi:hypothetical protein
MNNEPVAWMSKIDNHIVTFDKRLVDEAKHAGADNWMPMYLHPVKEQDTDCQYCKQGCIRCDARKQLTDEEIYETWFNYGCGMPWTANTKTFARAILRKAQEK